MVTLFSALSATIAVTAYAPGIGIAAGWFMHHTTGDKKALSPLEAKQYCSEAAIAELRKKADIVAFGEEQEYLQ